MPVRNCVCATQPDICTYACPGSICDHVTLWTIRTPVASITVNALCVIPTFRLSSIPLPVTVMEFHAERIHSADPHQLCACEMTYCISLPPLHFSVLVLWPKLVSECYCQEFPWELVLALWIWILPLIKPQSNHFYYATNLVLQEELSVIHALYIYFLNSTQSLPGTLKTSEYWWQGCRHLELQLPLFLFCINCVAKWKCLFSLLLGCLQGSDNSMLSITLQLLWTSPCKNWRLFVLCITHDLSLQCLSRCPEMEPFSDRHLKSLILFKSTDYDLFL